MAVNFNRIRPTYNNYEQTTAPEQPTPPRSIAREIGGKTLDACQDMLNRLKAANNQLDGVNKRVDKQLDALNTTAFRANASALEALKRSQS